MKSIKVLAQVPSIVLRCRSGLLLLAAIVFVGCNRGPERAIVYGKITYDGKEVTDGEISFVPKPGTTGSGGGSRIVRGEYRADARGGVIVGDYKVRIEGFEVAPGAEPPPAIIGIEDSRGKPYLPEKYHANTELELTISDGGSLEHNFDLPK